VSSKKLLSVCFATLLAFQVGASPVSAGEDLWEGFENDSVMFQIAEHNDTFNVNYISTPSLRPDGSSDLCTQASIDLGSCPTPRGRFILPQCQDHVSSFCVEEVVVRNASSSQQSLTFLRNVNGLTFSHPALPKNATASLWRSSDETVFVALAALSFDATSGPPVFSNLALSLQRVKSEPCTACSVPQIRVGGGGRLMWFNGWGLEHEFTDGRLFAEDGLLWRATKDSEPFFGEISLRLPEGLKGGLFFGRSANPRISTTKIDNSSDERWVFSADSVELPRFFSRLKGAEMSSLTRNYLANQYRKFCERHGVCPLAITGMSGPGPQTIWSTDFIDMVSQGITDAFSSTSQAWRFESKLNEVSPCYGLDQIGGVLSTNAPIYESFAPIYRDGFLSYKVSGLHYLPDGITPFAGTYDFVLKDSIARCLYGYSNAPVSARIQVTDGQEPKVATTTLRTRGRYLIFTARNFSFSTNEIKVEILQPQTKTLTTYTKTATALTSKQKAEVKETVAKGKGNTKFICTGIRLQGQPQSLNTLVRKRAKLACDYAKSLDPSLKTYYQTKVTKAPSFNGKVLVVSK